jgi:hypothetical protein
MCHNRNTRGPARASSFNLLEETVVTLLEATRRPICRQGRRPGRPINKNTLARWATAGVRVPGGGRVVLQTIKLGGTGRLTSLEAIERFFAAVNGHHPQKPTPAQVRHDHARADRECEAAGV